jgi:DNA polymerase III delta prime subunit
MNEKQYHKALKEQFRAKLFVANGRNRMVYYKDKSFSLNLSKLTNNRTFSNDILKAIKDNDKMILNNFIAEDSFDEFYKTASYLNRESNRKIKHFNLRNQKVNIAFLNWTITTKGKVNKIRSPFFSCSTSIEKSRGKKSPFILSFNDNYLTVNPFVIMLVEKEYGFTLPSTVVANQKSFMNFFNYFDSKMASNDKIVSISNQKAKFTENNWTIEFANATVDDISFQNDVIINEYNYAIKYDVNSRSFSKLFSVDPKVVINETEADIDFTDEYIVVPSDKTQSNAIRFARKGASYIIQGPPGTGKSQTITNLISDYVARNKKVLFVCEKKAALGVVNDRLNEAGLGDMSVFINDSVSDKRSFINSLKDTYETCLDHVSDDSIASKRHQLAVNLNMYMDFIKNNSTKNMIDLIDAIIDNSDDTESRMELHKLVNVTGVIGSSELDICVSRFLTDYDEFININAKYLVNEFYDRNKILLQDKSFATSRKIIEHESNKKRSHQSIREMLLGHSRKLIMNLKPIWLMSVDAVSGNFSLDHESFDLVIFDEASQIRLEDTSLITYRANQMIIVGDEQQLAPTNFFSGKNDIDSEMIVESNGNSINLDLYTNNLLDQSNINLNSVMLKYHYRSQSECLIGFSNANFYNGELITIPSRSSEDGISFHFMDKGVYTDRRNNTEAKYIAEQLRDMLKSDKKESVGIVAFSEAQQKEIQQEVVNLCESDSEFAELYKQELDRDEDYLFIKNLENVQGDERDVIIISICYGYNEDGRMRMGFGPVNQDGGGKRLNVVFSRSKKRMMIVSSIKHTDIVSNNEGALLLQDFLHYAENVSNNEVSAKSKSVDCNVVKSISNYLSSQGLEVSEGIGNDVFNIDIALHGEGGYKMGIVIDKLDYHTEEDIIENLFLKSNTLKNFGWNVKIVSVFDWIYNKDEVFAEILAEAS